MSENIQSQASAENAGPGHNQPEVVWDRWVKSARLSVHWKELTAKCSKGFSINNGFSAQMI